MRYPVARLDTGSALVSVPSGSALQCQHSGSARKHERTDPVTSDFVGPNQLAIEIEVHPLRVLARRGVLGGVVTIRIGTEWGTGGCVGVGPNGGGPIPTAVGVIY